MVGMLRLAPGSTFAGDFEIRRVLARGGMGTVYVVLDRVAGEERALKVLLPELVANEQSRRRFQREAQVASEVPSPYVPRIHRAGVDDDTGLPFISMELLSGSDLRQHVKKRGALPLQEAAPLLEQLGHALRAAHGKGLVHRDLKPENVFLDESEGAPQVKLLDFGVVKVLDRHHTSALGTAAVGSPMWMAPEQTSAGGRIAPATDVWAYGLVAFYVLTGLIYWKSARDERGVAGLLREMHVDPIEPPSRRLAEAGSSVQLPDGFDAWFSRAVARSSIERYRDGGEALTGLRPVLGLTRRRVDRSALAFAQTMSVSREVVDEVRRAPQATTPMGSVSPEDVSGEDRSDTLADGSFQSPAPQGDRGDRSSVAGELRASREPSASSSGGAPGGAWSGERSWADPSTGGSASEPDAVVAWSEGPGLPPAPSSGSTAAAAGGAATGWSAPGGSALAASALAVAPDGSAPDGSAPDGSAPDGSAPDGSAPDGSAPDGSAPDRSLPHRMGPSEPARGEPAGGEPARGEPAPGGWSAGEPARGGLPAGAEGWTNEPSGAHGAGAVAGAGAAWTQAGSAPGSTPRPAPGAAWADEASGRGAPAQPWVPEPARGTPRWVWAAGLLIVGLIVAALSALIVWVVLSVARPAPAGRGQPRTSPSGPPPPTAPVEVRPSPAPPG